MFSLRDKGTGKGTCLLVVRQHLVRQNEGSNLSNFDILSKITFKGVKIMERIYVKCLKALIGRLRHKCHALPPRGDVGLGNYPKFKHEDMDIYVYLYVHLTCKFVLVAIYAWKEPNFR